MSTMLVSHRVIHGQMAPQDIRYILRSEPRHGEIFFSFICRKIIKGYLILISLVYLHKDNRKLSHFLYPSFICAKVIKSYFPLQAFSRSTPHLTRARHPFQLSLLLSKSSHRLYRCLCFPSVFVFVFVELDEISWNVIKGLRYFWLNGSLLYFIIGMYYVASFSTTHMYFHFLLSSIYFLFDFRAKIPFLSSIAYSGDSEVYTIHTLYNQ